MALRALDAWQIYKKAMLEKVQDLPAPLSRHGWESPFWDILSILMVSFPKFWDIPYIFWGVDGFLIFDG